MTIASAVEAIRALDPSFALTGAAQHPELGTVTTARLDGIDIFLTTNHRTESLNGDFAFTEVEGRIVELYEVPALDAVIGSEGELYLRLEQLVDELDAGATAAISLAGVVEPHLG